MDFFSQVSDHKKMIEGITSQIEKMAGNFSSLGLEEVADALCDMSEQAYESAELLVEQYKTELERLAEVKAKNEIDIMKVIAAKMTQGVDFKRKEFVGGYKPDRA